MVVNPISWKILLIFFFVAHIQSNHFYLVCLVKKHECRYEQFYKIEDFDWMRLKEMDANSASKNSRVERSWTETAYVVEKLFSTRV